MLFAFALAFAVGYALMTVLRKEHLTAGCTTPSPQKGFDRIGNDIQTIDNIQSAQGCADKCCENAQCASYTYNEGNKKCFLKSGNPAVVPSFPGAYTGLVIRTTAAAPLPPPLANGKIYKCNTGPEFGVVLDNKLTGFPSPEVAASYSPSWSADATTLNCSLYTRATGPAPPKVAAPAAAPASTPAPTPAATPAATPAVTPPADAPAASSGGMDTTTIVLIVLAVLTVVGAGVFAYTKMARKSYPTYGNRWR